MDIQENQIAAPEVPPAPYRPDPFGEDPFNEDGDQDHPVLR